MLDGWVKSDDLAKMWGGAYVTQVKKVGHRKNPMHVMRVRLQDQYDAPRSNEKVLKAGVEPLRSSATSSGYNFIALLAAKTIKENGWQFDPSLVRIVYARRVRIPDITKKKVGAKSPNWLPTSPTIIAPRTNGINVRRSFRSSTPPQTMRKRRHG